MPAERWTLLVCPICRRPDQHVGGACPNEGKPFTREVVDVVDASAYRRATQQRDELARVVGSLLDRSEPGDVAVARAVLERIAGQT